MDMACHVPVFVMCHGGQGKRHPEGARPYNQTQERVEGMLGQILCYLI